MVEHRLAKARVAGSNPVSRSKTIYLVEPATGSSKGFAPFGGSREASDEPARGLAP